MNKQIKRIMHTIEVKEKWTDGEMRRMIERERKKEMAEDAKKPNVDIKYHFIYGFTYLPKFSYRCHFIQMTM